MSPHLHLFGFEHVSGNVGFALVAYVDEDFICPTIMIQYDDGSVIAVALYLMPDQEDTYYFAQAQYQNQVNQTVGLLDVTTYFDGAMLTYTASEGGSWDQEFLMDYYETALAVLIHWVD